MRSPRAALTLLAVSASLSLASPPAASALRGGSRDQGSGAVQGSGFGGLCGGNLWCNGVRVLSGIEEDVLSAEYVPGGAEESNLRVCYIKANAARAGGFKAWQTRSMGILPPGTRAVACSRQKLWWMGPTIGCCDSPDAIPAETQFLLLSLPRLHGQEEGPYALVLPMVSGTCRSSVSGIKGGGRLSITTETGCHSTIPRGNEDLALVVAGGDPFKLLREGFKALSLRTGTFKTRADKALPGTVDVFGWCTWDAFYHQVSGSGIERGLRELERGGTPARFLIVDDGWQSTRDFLYPAAASSHGGPLNMFKPLTRWVRALDEKITGFAGHIYGKWVERAPRESIIHPLWEMLASTVLKRALRNLSLPDESWRRRLVDTGASQRFKDTLKAGETLPLFIKRLKSDLGVAHVYFWHSLLGYWSGVGGQLAQSLGSDGARIGHPVLSKGMLEVEPTLKYWAFVMNGVGLGGSKGGAAFDLFERMHGELLESGVDGVKVDGQAAAVTLGGGRGGSVAFTKAYIAAMEASVSKRFSGAIACMCHPTECLYSYETTSILRASDDFWPRNEASHTVHAINVAWNSLFLGEIGLPDWDMFQSRNAAASLHACLRAVGGCGVYVSDHPGEHNFDILKRIALPSGHTLRALFPGRPTRDCLFRDVGMDGDTALKIWNANLCGGVVGAFNVQGSSWRRDKRMFWMWDASPRAVKANVKPADVEEGLKHKSTQYAIFINHYASDGKLKSSSLGLVGHRESTPIQLENRESAISTIVPLDEAASSAGLCWAPLGLIDMYNAGGAVLSSEISRANVDPSVREVRIEAKSESAGRFGVYSSLAPESASVDGVPVHVTWDDESGIAAIHLAPVSESSAFLDSASRARAPRRIILVRWRVGGNIGTGTAR